MMGSFMRYQIMLRSFHHQRCRRLSMCAESHISRSSPKGAADPQCGQTDSARAVLDGRVSTTSILGPLMRCV